ncbi:glycoside hydrolase family 3 protein [Kalaharituber pfeilii]|nr:glycoside hydrolase family 3 protein [Kalaharituber pfeilii]
MQYILLLDCPLLAPIYKNPRAPIGDRIADLLSLGQLMQGDMANWMNSETGEFNATGLEVSMEYKRGAFYVGQPVDWECLAVNIERAQKWLLENTTLGIPALIQTEGIHGFLIGNAAIFNSPIGLGCSWDPPLIEKMAEVISREAATLRVNNLLAPVVDVARELRFGRSRKVAATVKHFAAFGTPEQGLNTAPVHGGEREMRRTNLPAFKKSIIDADAWSVMGAYHSYDGVPAAADYHLLTEILRDEWGYKNYVISNAGASDKLCNDHALCERGDMRAVTMLALTAGNDVEMGGGSFNYRKIPELIEDGTLDLAIVDRAVSRPLTTKFKTGLFENPLVTAPKSQWTKLINNAEAKELARKLDRESIVLLEKYNNLLPLNPKTLKSIAVVGPMAHGFMNYGDYVVYNSQYRGVTPLDGIKSALTGTSVKVNYAQGAERWSSDKSGFPAAIYAVEKSDVAVVVVGTWSRDQTELWRGFNATTGEHVDVHNLKLVGAQADLVRAIIDTGKPQQFYPGEQGGNALADILSDIGTRLSYYDYLKGARYVDPGKQYSNGTLVFGHQFVLEDPRPLYPFGYGESFSTFDYSDLKLSKTNATATDKVVAKIKVKNTSKVDGTEVVQLVVTPNKELKGFKKVKIGAGKQIQVEIPIYVADLGVWNLMNKYVVEKAEFIVQVGNSSESIQARASFWV